MGSVKFGKFFRLNASRSGVSVSGGVSGLRLSVGSKGIRTHVTVPGTGYTKTNTLLSFKKIWNKKKKEKAAGTSGIKDKEDNSEEPISEVAEGMLPVEDELVLIMPRRRPFGSFTDKSKADRAVNKAIEAYNADQIDVAIENLEQAHKLNDDDMEVLLYLAVIYYMYNEDYAKSIAYFNLLPYKLLNEDMKLAMADCLHETEDYEGSMDLLNMFVFDDLEDMERTTLLARNHIALREFSEAEDLLKTTIGRKRKMTPYLTDAKYWLGDLYLQKGDYENAKKYLMAVYNVDKTYEDIGLKIEEVAMNGNEAD